MKFKNFGKYTIIKKIASGGMAEIFLAAGLSPTGLSRFFVIKRILSQYSENRELKEMFKTEGRVACNLKHKNIVPMYEFDIEQDQFYLIMDYISGKTVRDFIKKLESLKSTIDIRHSVFIAQEIASGLSYAHNAIDSSTGKPLNLIHRDISPQNAMISYEGEVRLIDFGISKVADIDLTRAGHLKGKFNYMSPEQARGEKLDTRTDIFCLGIILWELLSGKRLFKTKNEMDALKKIKHCDIPDIQSLNPKVPNELARIVHKALNKNKNLRHDSASELAKELNIFLNKNYSEFSQHDFNSFVKKIYSKEIMAERDLLKNYAKELKKYKDFLYSDDSFEGALSGGLDIPNLESNMNKSPTLTMNSPKTETKRMDKEYEEQDLEKTKVLAEDHQEYTLEINREDSKLSQNTATNKISRSKIPVNNYETNTANKQVESKENDNLELVLDNSMDSKPLLQQYKNLKESSFSMDRKIKVKTNNQQFTDSIPVISNMFYWVALIAIVLTSAIGYKKRHAIVNSPYIKEAYMQIKGNKIQETKQAIQKESYTKTSSQVKDRGIKKVWVQTKPSGAYIYVNNKVVGITPIFLEIDSKKPVQFFLKKQNYKTVKIQKNSGQELRTLDISLERIYNNRVPTNKITIIE